MNTKNSFLILLFAGLFTFSGVWAAPQPDVVINEIAWMGTTASATDEWLELKNNTSENIHLDGWLLKTTDEKIKAYLTGQIPAHGFYLLERTDDTTVAGIKADFIYKGSLGNEGQSLELYKDSATLIDAAAFSSKWPAGDNAKKLTMERAAGSWQTSSMANGTPKAENSAGTVAAKAEPTGIAQPAAEATTPKSYPAGVVINEILPAPEGPDETQEWIELHNTNTFEVDLAGWKIKDAKGAITAYTFGSGKKIAGNGYLLLKRPETKITLNNDEDTVNLLFPNGTIASTISYKEARKSQSYNKTGAGWSWSIHLTPGSQNNIAAALPKNALKNTGDSDNSNISLAAVGDSIGKNVNAFSDTLNQNGAGKSNPWLLFLIAAAVTLASGAIILLLKFKIFKKSNERS